jgi:membrane protein YdbS with pleckstrin-like domain
VSGDTDKAAAWIYTGVWAVLVRWFRVPQDPPTLPSAPGERVDSFQPAPAFLNYLKFWFWLALIMSDAGLTIGYLAVAGALVVNGLSWVAVLLLPLAIVLIVGPDIPVFIGLHLRFDTTWYVMSEHSMRIRRGIWVIQETTITFENVQNVKLTQGPLQRHFGIANVMVDTAGGSSDRKQRGGATSHQGIIEGVTQDDAARLRDLILGKLRRSATAGLGDDEHHHVALATGAPAWLPEHLALLRDIRDDLASLKPSTL